MADPRGNSTTMEAPGGPRKVAIPRLPKVDGDGRQAFGLESSSGKDAKNRVSHACEPCRQRKTKCSGERPVCRHCEDFRISCYYGEGKRDRAKNEILTLQTNNLNLQNKVESYEKLLEKLSLQVDLESQLAIRKAIGKAPHTTAETGAAMVRDISPGSDEPTNDPFRPAVERIDRHNSMWASRVLGEDMEARVRTTIRRSSILTETMTLDTPSYHMDDLDITVVGDQIDPYAFPPKDVAGALVKSYFATVHPVFPIVLEELFMMQYESFYAFPFTPESSKRWLAILNAIFAIGVVYSQLVNPDMPSSESDHLQYFARARVLSAVGGMPFEDADLQQIQVTGLMGMYLMATSQTNRAWKITGLALRCGQTLGLHRKSDSSDISDSEKEMRARIWYAIRSLEQMLAVMTGRSPAVNEQDCTAPLPMDMDEDIIHREVALNSDQHSGIVGGPAVDGQLDGHSSSQPLSQQSPHFSPSGAFESSSPNPRSISPAILYFAEHAKVSRITVDALNSLYCPETMKMSWLEIQGKILDLDRALSEWKHQLPPVLDFGAVQTDQTMTRQRMSLAFQYYHTRLIINRPCLCRADGRKPSERHWPETFNRNAAITCIQAARDTIKLILQILNLAELYAIAPWWCLFHYLVSAGSVVIVEIAMKAEHMPGQSNELFSDATKVVRWLHVIGKDIAAARKAWTILSRLLGAAARKIGRIFNHHREQEVDIDSSAMLGVENTGYQNTMVSSITSENKKGQPLLAPSQSSLQGNLHTDISQSGISGYSVGDLGFLAAFDEFPMTWDQIYEGNVMQTQTSIMFPTPQQMHGIDIAELLSHKEPLAEQVQKQGHPSTHPATQPPHHQPPQQLPHRPHPLAHRTSSSSCHSTATYQTGYYSGLDSFEPAMGLQAFSFGTSQSVTPDGVTPSSTLTDGPTSDTDDVESRHDGDQQSPSSVSPLVALPLMMSGNQGPAASHKHMREDPRRRQQERGKKRRES